MSKFKDNLCSLQLLTWSECTMQTRFEETIDFNRDHLSIRGFQLSTVQHSYTYWMNTDTLIILMLVLLDRQMYTVYIVAVVICYRLFTTQERIVSSKWCKVNLKCHLNSMKVEITRTVTLGHLWLMLENLISKTVIALSFKIEVNVSSTEAEKDILIAISITDNI